MNKYLKNPLSYVILFLLSVLLHNVWYAIFGFEEAVFFFMATIIAPLGIILSLAYLIVERIKK